MLYTVRPLERIYKDMNQEEKEEPYEEKVFDTPHGQIYTRKLEDKYIINQIVSSDMSDYLNEAFQPGCEYNPDQYERMFE